MPQPFSAARVHNSLTRFLGNRSELGAGNAVLNRVLEARNPFAPGAARAPRPWFLWVVALAAVTLAGFWYFESLRG